MTIRLDDSPTTKAREVPMIAHRFLLECPEITTSRKLIPFFRHLFNLVADAANNGGNLAGLAFLADENITLDSLNLQESDDTGFYDELPNNRGHWNVFFDKDTLQGDIVLFDDVCHYGIYCLLSRSGVLVSACHEGDFVNKHLMCWTDSRGELLETTIASLGLPPCRPIVQLTDSNPRKEEFGYQIQEVFHTKHGQEFVVLFGVTQYTVFPRRFVKFVLEPQDDWSKANDVLSLIKNGVIPA